jgi:hypothetical protein
MVEAGSVVPTTTYGELLERPIAMEEISSALQIGGRNKAPGSDGIGLEFYKENWATNKDDLCTVMNQIFMEKTINTQQNTV